MKCHVWLTSVVFRILHMPRAHLLVSVHLYAYDSQIYLLTRGNCLCDSAGSHGNHIKLVANNSVFILTLNFATGLTEMRSLTIWCIKNWFFFPLSLTVSVFCFSSKGWPNKYAIGLICVLPDFIQLFWFAIVSRLGDQELCREYTVDTMNKAEKKERQMSWAEIHVSSINLFILSFSK